MPATADTWKHILRWLCTTYAPETTAEDVAAAERLTAVFPPISGTAELDRELESVKGKLGDPRDYIYLTKSERVHKYQPILGVSWNNAPAECNLRLRLLLCRPSELDDGIEGLGFRLEAPEGRDGSHSFFHAQLIKLPNSTPARPEWLPDKEPTLPLAARDEVQLVVALAVSLYGAGVLNAMQDAQRLDIVRDRIRTFAEFLRPLSADLPGKVVGPARPRARSRRQRNG
jgi:hypothetical protein